MERRAGRLCVSERIIRLDVKDKTCKCSTPTCETGQDGVCSTTLIILKVREFV
jgi:hypothetical protein